MTGPFCPTGQPHRWACEPPSPGAAAVRGVCVRCGAERSFSGAVKPWGFRGGRVKA